MTTKRTGKSAKGKKVSLGKGKNWLIAIDPYAGFDVGPLREFAVETAGAAGAQVVAAYVLAPAALNWTGEFSGPWVNRYKPSAEEKLRSLFPDERIHTTVVPCKEPGQRASVRTLTKFAAKIKAEALVISTHARHGLERWALGSFAETVILASKTPVLVVNPQNPMPKRVRRMLVPTDLTKASEKFVSLSASLAKQLGAEVVLFYKQPDPLDPIIQQGVYSLGGGWVSVQNFIDSEAEANQKRLQKLEGLIAKKGVGVSHVVDSSSSGLIEAINTAAKEQSADLITVWTNSGPLSAAVLGSVARGLVRTAKVPVLVRR